MIEIDVRGLVCPLPVLKARKVLLGLPENSHLAVLTTDPRAPDEFRLFCAENNYHVERIESVDQSFRIVIKKT